MSVGSMSAVAGFVLLAMAAAASARSLSSEESAARVLLSCPVTVKNPYIKLGKCVTCKTLTNNYSPNSSIRTATCTPCGKLGQPPCNVGAACALTVVNAYVLNNLCASCSTVTNNFVAGSSALTSTCTICGPLGSPACFTSGCNMGIANPVVRNGVCASCDANANNYIGNANVASAQCNACGQLNQQPCTQSEACKGISNPWVTNGVCASCNTFNNRYNANAGATTATCTGCWEDGTTCGAGTTCNNCCRQYTYWYGPAFTKCGDEPCYPSGTVCLLGSSCNKCCSGGTHYQFPGAACN